ncbi:GNAT family N-acetyltransferase, partial [Amycolatopsis mediterranei]
MLVENVVVAAEYRRSGVGAALVEAAFAIARQARCYKVLLAVPVRPGSRPERFHARSEPGPRGA